jgi:hypothetical protein
VGRVAADVLGARGEARAPTPDASADGVAALQRVIFAGLVPLAGAGAPATPIARELAALETADLVRAIETRGAETLGRSLRGAPADVVARAAASVSAPLAAIVLEAARGPAGDGAAAARDSARRLVAAAVATSGEAAVAIGLHATAAALEGEGGAAVMAVAQRLPPELGRRLLAAAGGNG